MISIGLGKLHETMNKLKPNGFRQNLYSLLICTFAINILSLALPVMTLQVYDRILPNPGTGTLPILIAGVCLAVMLEAILRLSRSYVIGRSGAAYEHMMACSAMRKILNADISQMGSYGIGEHLHRMAAVGKLKDFFNGYCVVVLAELVFVPIFFFFIVYIGNVLALIPFAILIAFVATSLWRGRCLKEALKKREKADDSRFNFLIESLEGVHTLKAFALEKFFERRYEALEEQSCIENYHVTEETAKTFNIGAIFSHLMVISVICFGAWFVLEGQLTTGALIATLLLSGRIMQPIQKALGLWARYQDFSLAVKHVESLLDTPQKTVLDKRNPVNFMPDGRLKLESVSYCFNGEKTPIFSDVSFELKRGEVVLITGAHGSGKTTLLSLIAGLYPCREGEIEVDGEDVNSLKPEEIVKHVGFIRSRPIIFRGSIRDNITCFGQTNEAQAKEIAALLDVDKDVAKLPSGFDTFVNGNNTDSIPPGLKQRIAMVRVLATKPRIILFDNADRSLDKEGYSMIYSLLARLKGKATMILVSDDLNIKALAGRHYHLENGLLNIADKGQKTNIEAYKELRL